MEFPLTKIEALPKVTSDHRPILLTAKRYDTLKRTKSFCFEEA